MAGSVFSLGALGGCVAHTPCACGGTCPNTWNICTYDACTAGNPPVSGATVIVKNGAGTTINTCSTSTSLTCSPCSIPDNNLTVNWTNTSYGNHSNTLFYDAPSQTWKSSCYIFTASESFHVILVCSGGNWLLTVEVDESSGSCGSLRTYTNTGGDLVVSTTTCSPLSVLYNVNTASRLFTVNHFTGFTISGANTAKACCLTSLPTADTYTATITKTGYGSNTASVTTICNNNYSSYVGINSPAAGGTITVYGCGYGAGVPLPGASVTITGAGGGSGTTDASGHFSWTPTASGPYTVTVSKSPCYAPSTTTYPACRAFGGVVRLTPAAGYQCCGNIAIPTTLHCTDSAGTITNFYPNYGCCYNFGWSYPTHPRVYVYNSSTGGVCTNPTACVGGAGGFRAEDPTPHFTTATVPVLYVLQCDGTLFYLSQICSNLGTGEFSTTVPPSCVVNGAVDSRIFFGCHDSANPTGGFYTMTCPGIPTAPYGPFVATAPVPTTDCSTLSLVFTFTGAPDVYTPFNSGFDAFGNPLPMGSPPCLTVTVTG